MSYPRPITSIHQVEVTSKCNLRCVYCPSPKLESVHGRKQEHMSMEVFDRALEWAKHFDRRGTQNEFSLTGIGEGLLHPEFVEMIRRSRKALPENRIVFSTNGILLTEELCKQIARYRPEVYVSLHRPEKAAHAVNAAKKYRILAGVNASAATQAFDWAGQVDWPVSAAPIPCEYLRTGWAVVLADGRVTTCCLDASGAGVVGHVDDEIGSLKIAPYSLCESCHMTVPDPATV